MDGMITDGGAGGVPGAREDAWYPTGKRAVDAVLAVALLIPATPLILLVMALVKLTSRGPALHRQVRSGLGGRPFTLYKIRTMAHKCEAPTVPVWSPGRDLRVTTVGWFLRRSHVDELPQLWNVLRGEMSLVGPRPERPEFVTQFQRALPHYGSRLRVPPGVTGLAQVQLPPDCDLAAIRRKLVYDLYYIRRMGFWLDLRLLLGTALLLVGIPFNVARAVCRIPGGEIIEEAARPFPDRPATVVSEPA
jgi:lipopolysaccharide/colanic/teichoic acid biosynthesis glycosyltransferase